MLSDPIPIKSVEVLISFLTSNDTVGFISSARQFDEAGVRNYIQKKLTYYRKLELKSLEKRVSDKERLLRLRKHRWFLQSTPLKYIGTWPHVGDLPKDWCSLSVVDASLHLNNLHSTYSSARKIYSMIPHISEILRLLPPILVMGSEIRDTNNNLLLPFDADDGSHRCIAAAICGIKEIMCYVGIP